MRGAEMQGKVDEGESKKSASLEMDECLLKVHVFETKI